MKFRTKITALIVTLSLFFGGVFSLTNASAKEVKAAEFTPTYDTTDSYAVIKATRFYALTGGDFTRIQSIRFTNNLTTDELSLIRSKSGSRICEAGTIAIGSDGNEFKTDGCYIPVYLPLFEGQSYYDCIVYSPVAKIYAPTSCNDFLSGSNVWPALKSITFEKDAFDTTNVTSMTTMFSGISVDTIDISNFNCPNVTDLSGMFSLTNVRNLVFPTTGFAPKAEITQNMFNQFNEKETLESYDFLANFDTSSVTNMQYMFCRAHPVIKDGVAQPLNFSKYAGSKFNTANVKDMASMFQESYFTSVNLTGLNTDSLTDMNNMFRKAWVMESVTFGDNWGSMCTNMSSVFYETEKIKTVDMSKLNSQSATTFNGMFYRCKALESVSFPSNLNTSNVTDMRGMFQNCTSLKGLDLSSFDITSNTELGSFVGACESLVVIYTPTNGMPSGKTIWLPSQFSTYAGISSINENTDKDVIDILVEYFLNHWETLRTSGNENGMCATLVDGSTAQHDYSELLKIYDMASVEQKNTISNTQDTADGTTIGDTMRYLQDVADGKQQISGNYNGEATQTGMSLLNISVNNNISLIVLISVLSILAISGYYVIAKRRQA